MQGKKLFESAIDFSDEDSDDDGFFLGALAAFVIDDGFNNADLVEQPNSTAQQATLKGLSSMQRSSSQSYALRLETMIQTCFFSKLYGFCRWGSEVFALEHSLREHSIHRARQCSRKRCEFIVDRCFAPETCPCQIHSLLNCR